jgi:hypothetical protein
MADTTISHPASLAIDIPLADCKPDMLLLALRDLLHRRAGRVTRICESMKRERRYSKAEEAKYRAMAEATQDLADELPKLAFVRLRSGYVYALDTTEQAMREAHKENTYPAA